MTRRVISDVEDDPGKGCLCFFNFGKDKRASAKAGRGAAAVARSGPSLADSFGKGADAAHSRTSDEALDGGREVQMQIQLLTAQLELHKLRQLVHQQAAYPQQHEPPSPMPSHRSAVVRSRRKAASVVGAPYVPPVLPPPVPAVLPAPHLQPQPYPKSAFPSAAKLETHRRRRASASDAPTANGRPAGRRQFPSRAVPLPSLPELPRLRIDQLDSRDSESDIAPYFVTVASKAAASWQPDATGESSSTAPEGRYSNGRAQGDSPSSSDSAHSTAMYSAASRSFSGSDAGTPRSGARTPRSMPSRDWFPTATTKIYRDYMAAERALAEQQDSTPFVKHQQLRLPSYKRQDSVTSLEDGISGSIMGYWTSAPPPGGRMPHHAVQHHRDQRRPPTASPTGDGAARQRNALLFA